MIYLFKDVKNNIKHRFNKSAKSYNYNNTIQTNAGETLIKLLLNYKNEFDNILDLGCGTGVVTEKLASTKFNSFHAIDISQSLLNLAKERLVNYLIEIYENDFDYLNLNKNFDLIFSNMALQWSLQFKNTLKNIYNHLSSNGIIAFSLPVEGTFPELNPTIINPFYSIESIAEQLSDIGFNILEHSSQNQVLYFDSLISALKSIKNVGANHCFNQSCTSLRGRSFLYNFAAKEFKDGEIFSLTYNIGYIIAQK